jgi:hypothetical protein
MPHAHSETTIQLVTIQRGLAAQAAPAGATGRKHNSGTFRTPPGTSQLPASERDIHSRVAGPPEGTDDNHSKTALVASAAGSAQNGATNHDTAARRCGGQIV